MNKINIPEPKNVVFKYKRLDNCIKTYKGVIIQKLKDRFTAYIYGEGVRSFIFDRILKMNVKANRKTLVIK